jgi:hypothetical protein
MGRTVPTYREALEAFLLRWEREFGRALQDPSERDAFERLRVRALRHVAQGTLMSTGDLLERVLLSILVDMERDLVQEPRRPSLEDDPVGGIPPPLPEGKDSLPPRTGGGSRRKPRSGTKGPSDESEQPPPAVAL